MQVQLYLLLQYVSYVLYNQVNDGVNLLFVMCTRTNLHCQSKRILGCSCLNTHNRTKTEAKSNENLKLVNSASVLYRFLLSVKVRNYLNRVRRVFMIFITSRRKGGNSFELPAAL
jgi:hypothetical protein